jgi:hypothetical protein
MKCKRVVVSSAPLPQTSPSCNPSPEPLPRSPTSLSQADAKACFDRYDSDRNGRIGPRGVLCTLRDFHPSLSHAALRYIAVLLNMVDLDGSGSLGFKDVVQTLHAVELRTPEYMIRPGTWSTRGPATGGSGRLDAGRGAGGSHSPHTSPSHPQGPAKREPVIRSLDLDTFEYERKKYLIDR